MDRESAREAVMVDQRSQEYLVFSGEDKNTGKKQVQEDVALWAGKTISEGTSQSLKNAKKPNKGSRQSMRVELRPCKPDKSKICWLKQHILVNIQ